MARRHRRFKNRLDRTGHLPRWLARKLARRNSTDTPEQMTEALQHDAARAEILKAESVRDEVAPTTIRVR